MFFRPLSALVISEGHTEVARHERRYASLVYFAEHALIGHIAADAETQTVDLPL